MSLLTVEAKNFLVHKDLKIDLNKESCLVIGDSGKGKSSLSRLILAHIAQVPYPPNPLSDGENEGYTKTTHQGPDGKVYTVSRKYVREKDGSVKLDRFDVRGPDGYKKSLEEIMDTVFNGVFTSGRFDWNTYFNKKKGSVDRYKYFVDAIGGQVIEQNIERIEELEDKRADISEPRAAKRALWEQVEISDDEAEMKKQSDYYAKGRTIDEAATAKAEHLKKKHDFAAMNAQLDTHMNALQYISEADTTINDLNSDIADIDKQIGLFMLQKAEKEKQISEHHTTKEKAKKAVLTAKQLEKMEKDIIKKQKENDKINAEAEVIYKAKLQEIVDFQTNKTQFNNAINAFVEWEQLDKQWNELDQEIKDLKLKNEKSLKKLLPLPELEIGIKNKKPVILYKGRELDDSFSTGEQIEIALAIQVALNPTGDNFIVIPNAQDLGSKLRDVQKACREHNIQYLVEMTRPDEEFIVQVIDSEKDII